MTVIPRSRDGGVAIERSGPAAAVTAHSVIAHPDVAIGFADGLLRSAFDQAPIAVSVVDENGDWMWVNDAYCTLLGRQRHELIGRSYLEFTHPDDVAEDIAWRQSALGGRSNAVSRVKRYVAKDGAVIWVSLRAELVREPDGRSAYFVSVLEDVTERRAAQRALTSSEQLLRSIVEHTPNAISVQRPDGEYTMVNLAFEQRFGDAAVAPAGSPTAASDDRSGPLGTPESEAHQSVLRTGETVKREETVAAIDGDRTYLTVKYPLRDDDDVTYAVCTVYNDITEVKRRDAELADRLLWTDRLHVAADQDLFVLHGQPILDLSRGTVDQVELLVRLMDRRGSSALIPPGEFLPAAERLGLANIIDRWVVGRAVELAKLHHVEVNVSAQTICDSTQVSLLEAIVVDSGAPPANIIFEITETAVAQNIEMARRFAERMRDIGCSFALDDFGTGFGTFTYLKHLPVDYLKIDIEFVRDLLRSDSDCQVVRAIVGVAQEYGMRTIAEGVEDQATLELLGSLKVDYAQGYWIGRPIPLDELWPPQVAGWDAS